MPRSALHGSRGCKIMNWMLALPEIVLACAGLAILMIGVLPRQNMFFGCTMASIGALVVTAALVLTVPDGTGFSGQVISDGFARFMKLLVRLGAVSVLLYLSLVMSTLIACKKVNRMTKLGKTPKFARESLAYLMQYL